MPHLLLLKMMKKAIVVLALLSMALLTACGSKKIYITPKKQPLPQEFKQPCRAAKQLMKKPTNNKQVAELIVRQDVELKTCEAKRAGLVRNNKNA